jgi:Zn-dependent protease with chaperone function
MIATNSIKSATSRWIDTAIASRWAVAISALGLVFFPILLVVAVLPKLSELAARHVPVSVEKKLGTYVLSSGESLLPPSRMDLPTQEAYQERVKKLAQLAGLEAVQVEFRAGPPNAYALPGNIIILTDELIRVIADPDEVDAVIAHELGHLHQRHLIKRIVSSHLFTEVALRLNGQDGVARQMSSTLASLSLAPHYSRQHENEADKFAIDLLIENKQSPLLLALALIRLDNHYKEKGVARANYTSSHPDTAARSELATEAAKTKN